MSKQVHVKTIIYYNVRISVYEGICFAESLSVLLFPLGWLENTTFVLSSFTDVHGG